MKYKKVAIVCDWIKDWWGAEVVLEQLMNIFPKADIYTSIFFQKNRDIFEWRNIYTSYIQKIPIFNKSHKLALTLRPKAFESFDFSNYDIVISSTSAESKWVITKPETLQICYCHTPTRYFWSHYHEYINMMEFWILNPIWRWLMPKMVHKLRQWDYIAAQRPDYIISNSNNTAFRIRKYYDREATTIYPCIDTSIFIYNEKKEDFYICVGRCIPYKKFDLLVDAFNANWKKLVLITNTKNKLQKDLQKISNDNIEWKINITDDEKHRLLSKAKAFVFPPEEDFWLVPIEAMASWTPVIAYWKWGALETVKDWITGLFFEEQNKESLNKVIETFEELSFNPKKIREHSILFDKESFKKNILEFIKKHEK